MLRLSWQSNCICHQRSAVQIPAWAICNASSEKTENNKRHLAFKTTKRSPRLLIDILMQTLQFTIAILLSDYWLLDIFDKKFMTIRLNNGYEDL